MTNQTNEVDQECGQLNNAIDAIKWRVMVKRWPDDRAELLSHIRELPAEQVREILLRVLDDADDVKRFIPYLLGSLQSRVNGYRQETRLTIDLSTGEITYKEPGPQGQIIGE